MTTTMSVRHHTSLDYVLKVEAEHSANALLILRAINAGYVLHTVGYGMPDPNLELARAHLDAIQAKDHPELVALEGQEVVEGAKALSDVTELDAKELTVLAETFEDFGWGLADHGALTHGFGAGSLLKFAAALIAAHEQKQETACACWRRLAMQFDADRMRKSSMLKSLDHHYGALMSEADREALQTLLAAPPVDQREALLNLIKEFGHPMVVRND